MTLEQYKAKLADRILKELAADIRQHSEDYAPQTITEEYYLSDMRYHLIPANKGIHPFKIKLHGYGIEIHFENRWPAVFQFQNGKLQIGMNTIEEDCMERAVEDIRYLCSVFPKYSGKYIDGMKDAAIELQKDKMVREICDSTISSALMTDLSVRGLTCKTRRFSDRITLTIAGEKYGPLTFSLIYDDIMSGIERVRNYIVQNCPIKHKVDVAVKW